MKQQMILAYFETEKLCKPFVFVDECDAVFQVFTLQKWRQKQQPSELAPFFLPLFDY